MIELIEFINRFQKPDAETEEAIKTLFTEEKYKKNEYLLQAGQICTKAIYIKSGLIRRYYFHDSRDITIWFYGPDQMATSTASFFSQKPAYEYFQACDDTVVYSLSFQNEQILLENYPLFKNFHLRQLRFYLAGVDEVNYRLRIMSAKEKYIFLLKYYPYIIQRAKLKHLASFLDVSPETLSRIRATIS